MNNNKKNNSNDWILCRSKSIPGMFYYYNVISREAVWCEDELEKKSLRKDILKTSNAFHHCAEPISPPGANDEICKNFNMDASYKLRPNCKSVTEECIPPSQICSQVLFPKDFLSQLSTYIPNIMWTPVPLSTQMVMHDTSEARKKRSDQITQTEELKECMLVETSGMSLSDRFLSHNTKKKFNFNDPVKDSRNYNFHKIKHIHRCFNNDTRLITLQNMHRFSPVGTEIQSVLKGPLIKNQLNKKPDKDDNKASSFELSTENKKNKLDSSLNSTGTQTLDQSDLRLLLLAKKKNKFYIQDTFNKFKGDYINKNACVRQERAPKKYVTFDLTECDSSESMFKFTTNKQKDVPWTFCSNQKPISEVVNIHTLKSLKKSGMKTDLWFIMADLNVLLNDFEYIENFVKQDESCQLVIPDAVFTIIRELSTLTQLSSETVASKKIIRRVMDAPRHILLLESVRDINVSISRQILDCSTKLLERKFHVVLITTDIELLTNAKAVNLDCYMLEQIDYNIEHRYTQNDGNKGLVESRNNEENKESFLKKPNEFQPFVVDNIPETVFNRRIQIQNVNIDKMKNFKKVVNNDILKVTTSADNNSVHIPNEINAEHKLNNHRHINTAKSECMTSNQIVKHENDKGFNEPMNEPVKNLKVQINLESSKKNVKRSVNLKEIERTEQCENNKVRKDQNQPEFKSGQDQIAFDCTVDKNIISHQSDLNACSNLHETVSKKDNIGLNLLKESVDNSLNEKLKRFDMKNGVLAKRIVSRSDEWICSFTQIMENFMSHILWDASTTKFINHGTILEAADSIAKVFEDNESVKAAAYKLCALYNLITTNGKLKRNLKPDDILNTIGCGVLLVESLKAAIPHSPQLMETEDSLKQLLRCIESPGSDPYPYLFKTNPTVSRIDVYKDITAPKSTCKNKKDPLKVLTYLKKHFPVWKTYDEKCFSQNDESNPITVQSPKIIRTTGRHLSLVKINNVNELIVSENNSRGSEIPIMKQNDKENNRVDDDALKSARVNLNQKSTSNNDIEKKSIEVGSFDPLTKHNNTFPTSTRLKNGPNIIGNVRIIECFENKFKAESLDKSSRDYKVISGILNDDSQRKNISDATSETFTDVAYQTEVNRSDTTSDKIPSNVRTVTSDISNDDSGLGDENCHLYTIIKDFLIELSLSLKAIYKFLNDNAVEIKQKGVQKQNKKAIYDKTDKTYKLLLLIVDKLKRIIEREPDDSTIVKSLLIKAGVDVAKDKRISQYKQVVTKCLEQAYILKRGLKLLMFITGENQDSAPVLLEPDENYVCHFNISQ